MDKIKIEETINYSDKAAKEIADVYTDYYQYKSDRSGNVKQFQNKSFDDYLKISRQLFWNSIVTESEDLHELDLDFSLPFIRKEVMDFVGNIVKMNISPKLEGDGLGNYGVKVLQAMYKKWRLHNKDKVEKFWQVLYGVVNGTTCMYIGYDGEKSAKSYLRGYNPKTGQYRLEKKDVKMWDDAFSELVPLEEIYLSKIWERNIQKQGKVIRKHEMTLADFKKEFGHYKDADLVVPGNQIAEDSLFFQLLGGSGILTTDKIQVLKETNTDDDTYKIVANGIWINRLGKDTPAPMPFDHKCQPYVWGINEAIDEKFAYGLSTPFKLKDPHKILNTSFCVTPDTKILTNDLRWVTAESLKIGDKLVGFEEYGQKTGKTGRGSTKERRLLNASVIGTGRKIAPVYQVNLADGTQLKCTGNHRWLTWHFNGHGITWMRTDEMKKRLESKNWRGTSHKIFMPKPFDVVEQDMSYKSGYLGGLFDGEGHLSLGQSYTKNGVTRGMQMSFMQKEGIVLEKGIEYLKDFGFNITNSERKSDSCHHVEIKGGVREMMRALMSFRPKRLIKKWSEQKIQDSTMRSDIRPQVISVAYLGEMEIITLESSTKTYIAEGFCAHNTMLVERELRAIDPPVLTSDFEAPQIIFGQKRVIPVNDIAAYKEMNISEPSGQFTNMQNSLQGLMSSFGQGGFAQASPSKQPKSAREIIAVENLKQQALGNALVMYYDLVYQELMLVLKTMLQFYQTGKYANQQDNLIRTITVPNFPLSQGGTGNLEVRLVKTPQEGLSLYFEAVKKSIDNGKTTEIIEVPVEILNHLEFFIDDIKLEPEKSTELERAAWSENVLQPLLNVFIPSGVASIEKTFLRWAEKNAEHPADFASDQALGGIVSAWGRSYQMPEQMGAGVQNGNMMQSTRGTMFGSQSNGGFGNELEV